MFNLIILMLVTGAIGYLIGREVKERSEASDKVTNKDAKLTFTDRLKKANPFAHATGDQASVETWMKNSSNVTKIYKEWYFDLDDKSKKAFVRSLSQFASSFGIQLSWLNDKELKESGSEIYTSVEDLVDDFGLAYRKSENARTQSKLLTQLKKWSLHPASADNKELTTSLFKNLANHNLVTAQLPEKGSARVKREAMVAVIESFRGEKPSDFYQLFASVSNGDPFPENILIGENLSEATLTA